METVRIILQVIFLSLVVLISDLLFYSYGYRKGVDNATKVFMERYSDAHKVITYNGFMDSEEMDALKEFLEERDFTQHG